MISLFRNPSKEFAPEDMLNRRSASYNELVNIKMIEAAR